SHFLSELLLLWVFKLVATINGISTLAKVNLGLKKSETAKVNGDLLDGFWSDEVKEHQSNPSLLRALFKAFGKTYMLLSLWKISWGAFAWLGAYYVLRNLIRWTEGLEDAWQGHVWALVLFFCSMLGAISYHQMLTQCLRIAVQSRSALLVLIYRKSLRLSYVKGGIGDIVNLISNECNRIAEMCVSFHFMWSAAIEGLVICILIGIDLQVSAIPAIILIIIITMPLQYFLGALSAKASYTSTTLLTRRVALVNEVLTTIKLIKFYAWEKYYTAKLTGLREKEMSSTKRALLFKIGGFASVFITPVVSTLMCLVGLQYLGSGTSIRQVTASEVFTILSLFNTLRYPLMMLPQAVRSVAGAQRAVKKLEDFFKLPEIDALPAGPSPAPSESSSDPSSLLLIFENASFVWDGDLDHPHIYDLNLQLYRGQLLAIVGDVGSGRSLLAAVMGQIKLADSRTPNLSTCGYVPQEPWLINASIQDNILFGLEYDERKYSDVVRLCGLTRDLMLLSNGDQSLVSDLNLSAAQSQRLSLARCLYHDPDIILLDDILSDFDLAIAKRLFKEAIKNYMLKSRGKSVVLVTQQKQFLPDCDQILVMKGGRVVERGTFAELKARKINFSAFITPLNPEDANQLTIQQLQQLNSASVQQSQLTEETISKMIERNQLSVITSGGGLATINFENQNVVTKTIQENQLTMHTVDDFAAIGRHFGFTPGGEDRGEGIAAQKSIYERPFASYRIYMVIGSRGAWVAGIFIFAYYLVHAFRFFSGTSISSHATESNCVLRKSRALHKRVLESVMKAPMSFFDITPLGQILSNFARHLYQVDEQLPESMLQALAFSPILVGTVILVSIVVPWFWATLPLYAVLVWWLISRSNKATEKLKQLEALNKSPLFAHLSATLEGLFSIRLYHAEARFDAFNRTLIDADQKALYSLMLVKSMTALYIDLICALFIYMTALLVVVSRVKPSHAGLALANSLQLLLFAQWFVRSATDTHAAMQSVSASTYFAEHIPHEAPEIVKSNRPPPDWPCMGEIDFKNVVLRYNRYGVAVLKSVSFRIHHKERIGVVGRSGSGKTTLLVALLRIVELAQGEITVDGIDIRQIGLADLRSRIAVIPQEPVLLSGTIRSNLDPFGVRTDEEVWKALKSAHLGDKIHEMPLQLETPITENGKAFTQGERQLFCIARAVLLKSSIVVLDEPATAVDPETDELIRSVITENFAEATVILLASRFNVVVELDKVIVMEHGKVVEFDSPLALLENPRSKFSLMVAQSGEVDVSKLRNVAQGRADRRARGNVSGSSSLSPVGSSASRFARPRGASTGGGQQAHTPQAAGVQLHPLANSISAQDVQSTVSTTSSAKSDGNSKMPRSLEDLFNPHHSPAAASSGGRSSPPIALETPTSASPSRGHLSKLSVVTNNGHVPSSPSSGVGSPARMSSSAPSTYLALTGSPVTASPSGNGLGAFLPSYHQYRPATPDGEFPVQRKDDSS
ncbi:P-loop containing nucleoside triphosphate hydrolase protein, partial [Cladochytrium replicatum]